MLPWPSYSGSGSVLHTAQSPSRHRLSMADPARPPPDSAPAVILAGKRCVRWYLRYSLTYRDLEEIMAERGLTVDHVTIWRWVQRYARILNQRLGRERRHPNRSWRVDETLYSCRGTLGVLVPRCRFGRGHHRFHVVTQSGFGRCQALPAVSLQPNRASSTTSD